MLFSKCYFFNMMHLYKRKKKEAIGRHVLIINHLIYYVNKRTLGVPCVCPGFCLGSGVQKCCGWSSSSFLIRFSTSRLRLESVMGRL